MIRGAIVEPVGVDVGFEVVDGVEGLVPENSESAGGEGADKEGTEQAGGVGDGDSVEVIRGEVGVMQSLMDDGQDGFEMRASGDFGNDTTISCENVNL